jgi:hypothetical protein
MTRGCNRRRAMQYETRGLERGVADDLDVSAAFHSR